MASSHVALLPDRGVVRVAGEAARPFLQDLVTADMDGLAEHGAGYGALLTPQGKVLFDFIVLADGPAHLFDLPRAMAADFAKRLAFYRLRAKVEIADVSESMDVGAAWGDRPQLAGTIAADPRLAALGWRIVGPKGSIAGNATAADYAAHRIALGVPEGGLDFAYGDAFPHDADLDQLNGVAFKKGCYVGQEVVSRMEHRGTARRRIVKVAADVLPPPGTAITAAGRPVGTLGSSAASEGLALVRLDRAGAALAAGEPIMAGDTAVALSIPDWARFGWPSPSEAE